MRVALDARKFFDFGIGTTIRGLIRGIVEISPEGLELLVMGPAGVRDAIAESNSTKFVELDAPHYSFREMFAVTRTAQRAGADLIHVPHYVTPVASLPLVITIHDLIHLDTDRRHLPLGGRIYARWMIGRATRLARRIVTGSEATRREIERRFPRSRGRISVVHHGVRQPTRPPVDLANRAPMALFVGNDKPHKNVDRLVEAMALVRNQHPVWSLTLVGAPFDRYRGRPGVDCRGFVSDQELEQLYDLAGLVVQPSLIEGFGLPVAEAMSRGTPVVISAIPALLEVAGDAGIPIDEPTDIRSVARAIEMAIGDTDRRTRSAERGREISARYTWAGAAEHAVQLWREVATGTPRNG